MIKNLTNLADRLKGIKANGEDLTPEKLIELMKDEKEVELTINPFHMLDETQLTELKTNIKKEGYEEGKTAGSEIFAKGLKTAFGLTGDQYPGKDVDSLKKIINEKILADAKIEPEKKVKELTDSLQGLQSKYEQTELTYKSEVDNLKKNIEQRDIDFYLQSNIPQLNGIKPNHALLVYKSERQLKRDENGNLQILMGGKVLKDNLERPVDFSTDFTSFAKQNGWIGEPGRGGGNAYGGSGEFKTIEELMKHMEKNKINPDSAQGLEMINKFNEGK